MNINKIIEEVIKSKSFKGSLTDYLALEIAKEYRISDSEGFIIKEEVRELVKKEAKDIIKEVVEDYYEMSDIKTQIVNVISGLTKNEVIELLKK